MSLTGGPVDTGELLEKDRPGQHAERPVSWLEGQRAHPVYHSSEDGVGGAKVCDRCFRVVIKSHCYANVMGKGIGLCQSQRTSV